MNANHWTEEEIEFLTHCKTRENPLTYQEIAKVLTRHTKDSIAMKWQAITHPHKKEESCTLCAFCKHTNLFECTWFNPDNPQPVPGWKAKKKKIVYATSNGVTHTVDSYTVKECPNFERERRI